MTESSYYATLFILTLIGILHIAMVAFSIDEGDDE